MPRTQKLFVESLERRSLLAGDLMSSILSNTSAQANIGADQVAAQTDTSTSANVNAGLLSANASVDANTNAALNLGASGIVDNALAMANSTVDNALSTANSAVNNAVAGADNAVNNALATANNTVDNALGSANNAVDNVLATGNNAVGNVSNTVNDLTGNLNTTADNLSGNLNSTVDDVLSDTATTAGGVVSGVQNTASGAVNDLGINDIIHEVQVPTTTINNLLSDLGQVVNRPNLINELGLGNLPQNLTVGSLHGLNGLINSGGHNLNGFMHSLPAKVSHIADNAVGAVGNTAVVDSVFSRLGNIRHGLLS